MGLFNSLQISVSGIEAQSNQLGVIGTNIANATTTGYKTASVDFQQMVGIDPVNAPQTGDGVQAIARYGIANQGAITPTTSPTDLAVNGNGFFLVQDSQGGTSLTRAGSFVPDANGNLINTAGYTLLGYNLGSGALEPVSVPGDGSAVTISSNGVVSTSGASGTVSASYRIPLGTVLSPQNMTSINGDIFEPNEASGALTTGSAQVESFGAIESSSLESSSVDLTTQLTNMISTQRSYEANSKALTTSSDMLSTLFQAAAG